MIQKVTFHPSRIGCPSLPGTMKGMVHSIAGVKDVKVRYEDRSLDVTFDDVQTSPEEIIMKIGQELGLAMVVGETDGRKDGKPEETCPM